jgi:hypothetical protein
MVMGETMNNEDMLWAAVILQAFNDATWPMTAKHPGSSGLTERERSQAREWLLSSGNDFASICLWAGLEAECVRQKAKALASRGWPQDDWRQMAA